MRISRSVAIAVVGVLIVVAAVLMMLFMRGVPQQVETVLVVGTTYDPKTLDPALSYDIASAIVIQNIYDSLVGFKPGTTELIPKLAERWESNEDSTVWTFYIRRNAKFHDGTELTADVVKQSIDRAKQLKGPPAFLLDVIENVEVIDRYTIRFTLKYPFTPFASLTTFTIFAPVPPGAQNLEEKPIGTGPFKLESWKKGEQIVLLANKDYWRGSPKVDRIIIRIYPDPSTLRVALEKGEVDIALGIQPQDVEPLSKNPGIKMVSIDGLVIEWLGMNHRREPFNNTLFRRAVNYAINYDYILNVILRGTATRLYGPLPPAVFGYDPEVEKYGYKYNPDLARQLLAQAGYPDGKGLREIELIISTAERAERGEVAAVIQSNLKDVGINVKIVDLDWPSFLDRLFNHEFDMYMVDWFPDYVDPDDWIVPLFTTHGLNLDGYNNTMVNELAMKARQTLNPQERAEMYKQLQRMIIEDAPWAFLYVPKLYAFMNKNVEGFVLYPAYYIDFYPVYKTR
ncbi:MAG: ABC transporter substrate-binding protein [Ignisphaera sp.]|nr:ABC transporter substrate-binding protein [Ignisphaera sp.]MDW8085697.1 ABC transporter substrate-binding protein [Ignisphaera sp.]